MLMIQNGLPFRLRILNFVDNKDDAAALAAQTPINKVPILQIDDGGRTQTVFDSRVIVNHLAKTHGLRALTLDEENIVSAIYSCLDVSVALFLLRLDGFDIETSGGYMRRQRERITRNLNFIRPWVETLDPHRDWNYASMSLYAYIDWAEKRAKLLKPSEFPELLAFREKFARAPGVQETRLPE